MYEGDRLVNKPLSGVVFLDKPHGWTSRKAVNAMVRLFSVPGQKRIKAGHAGTLDPLATGMLPILLGEATRYAGMGLEADKSYRVSFDLSYQTDTLDCEGEVVERFDGLVTADQLNRAIEAFTGDIDQVPPAYSAIRINGERAHAMARKGETVEIPARPVTIYHSELVDFSFPVVTLDVRCSKGTYIRSLSRDIGAFMGVGGCVTALRRDSTGGWPAAMMVSMEQLQASPTDGVLPLAQWLRAFPAVVLAKEQAGRFVHGQRIQLDQDFVHPDGGQPELMVRVFGGEQLLGTGTLKPGHHRVVLHPARILPSAQTD